MLQKSVVEKARAWESKGKTWTLTKKEARKAGLDVPKIQNPNYKTLLREYKNYQNAAGSCKRNPEGLLKYSTDPKIMFKQCMADRNIELPGPLKPTWIVEKEFVTESTRECRSQGFVYQDNFQMTCKERPYKAKDWKGAKYVYFKTR